MFRPRALVQTGDYRNFARTGPLRGRRGRPASRKEGGGGGRRPRYTPFVRAPLLVTLFAAAAAAGTKGIEFLPKAENALELARTRGTLVFLTVIVDHDAENRAVIEQVFEDAKLGRTLESFACLLANPESDHGSVRVTPPGGKSTTSQSRSPHKTFPQNCLMAELMSGPRQMTASSSLGRSRLMDITLMPSRV